MNPFEKGLHPKLEIQGNRDVGSSKQLFSFEKRKLGKRETTFLLRKISSCPY
jgi:hypothetical protein